MEYQSERLLLREFSPEDFRLFFSIFSDPDVMRHAWIDHFPSEEAARPFFEEMLESSCLPLAERNSFDFAVHCADGVFVGYACILTQSRNAFGGIGEIGYFLLPDHWGKGYASEIADALCAIGFLRLELHRIWARCSAQNPGSEHVMVKLGMAKEGCARKARFKDGRWDDEPRYALLREDWTPPAGRQS